ncbi:hypothetical protein QFC20_004749 [Naganishia adeliensis]|uniref:Uncharacterized protein n=1 Tax=Naganishia adeliensis TaxID=92952 RepID=A0ACC2VWR4_9TREE|nr:hypothetical protein QFC20_004749 [Naganishia adeliensis]
MRAGRESDLTGLLLLAPVLPIFPFVQARITTRPDGQTNTPYANVTAIALIDNSPNNLHSSIKRLTGHIALGPVSDRIAELTFYRIDSASSSRFVPLDDDDDDGQDKHPISEFDTWFEEDELDGCPVVPLPPRMTTTAELYPRIYELEAELQLEDVETRLAESHASDVRHIAKYEDLKSRYKTLKRRYKDAVNALSVFRQRLHMISLQLDDTQKLLRGAKKELYRNQEQHTRQMYRLCWGGLGLGTCVAAAAFGKGAYDMMKRWFDKVQSKALEERRFGASLPISDWLTAGAGDDESEEDQREQSALSDPSPNPSPVHSPTADQSLTEDLASASACHMDCFSRHPVLDTFKTETTLPAHDSGAAFTDSEGDGSKFANTQKRSAQPTNDASQLTKRAPASDTGLLSPPSAPSPTQVNSVVSNNMPSILDACAADSSLTDIASKSGSPSLTPDVTHDLKQQAIPQKDIFGEMVDECVPITTANTSSGSFRDPEELSQARLIYDLSDPWSTSSTRTNSGANGELVDDIVDVSEIENANARAEDASSTESLMPNSADGATSSLTTLGATVTTYSSSLFNDAIDGELRSNGPTFGNESHILGQIETDDADDSSIRSYSSVSVTTIAFESHYADEPKVTADPSTVETQPLSIEPSERERIANGWSNLHSSIANSGHGNNFRSIGTELTDGRGRAPAAAAQPRLQQRMPEEPFRIGSKAIEQRNQAKAVKTDLPEADVRTYIEGGKLNLCCFSPMYRLTQRKNLPRLGEPAVEHEETAQLATLGAGVQEKPTSNYTSSGWTSVNKGERAESFAEIAHPARNVRVAASSEGLLDNQHPSLPKKRSNGPRGSRGNGPQSKTSKRKRVNELVEERAEEEASVKESPAEEDVDACSEEGSITPTQSTVSGLSRKLFHLPGFAWDCLERSRYLKKTTSTI